MAKSSAVQQSVFMNKIEKLMIGLLVLLTTAGIGAWMLWNYMIGSMV